MRATLIIGVILLVLGVAALGYQGVAWVTTRDTVAKVGPLEVKADQEHAIPLGPILCGAAVVGGIVLIVAGARKPAA
jgi:hypothetical protein